MHPSDHVELAIIAAKTVVVASATGAATIAAFLVAQAEQVPQDGSLAVILATALISALASLIYLFREDKKRQHDLELKKQETEQKRLDAEADKSKQASEDRNTREKTLMKLAIDAQENLANERNERQKLQERLTRLYSQLDPKVTPAITDTDRFDPVKPE
jgi:mannitol-specific phosphotransferase system IIBC component